MKIGEHAGNGRSLLQRSPSQSSSQSLHIIPCLPNPRTGPTLTFDHVPCSLVGPQVPSPSNPQHHHPSVTCLHQKNRAKPQTPQGPARSSRRPALPYAPRISARTSFLGNFRNQTTGRLGSAHGQSGNVRVALPTSCGDAVACLLDMSGEEGLPIVCRFVFVRLRLRWCDGVRSDGMEGSVQILRPRWESHKEAKLRCISLCFHSR